MLSLVPFAQVDDRARWDEYNSLLVFQVFTRLRRYTQHPEFNPEAVGKISVACKSMCQWVLALENYAEVYKIVQPKQKRCEEAQAALAIAKENLQQKQVEIFSSYSKDKTCFILYSQFSSTLREHTYFRFPLRAANPVALAG